MTMFDTEVNRHLNDVWKLQGSVGVGINPSNRNYCYSIDVIKEVE
jgi:hypothetical protein